LSDAGCLFECKNGRFKSLDDHDDDVQNIYLPISAHRLLIGAADECRTIGVTEFNKIAARHSYEWFISSESRAEVSDLSCDIGSLAGLLTEAELKRLAAELLKDLESSLHDFPLT
jgi:hypothetical protein